MSESSTTTPKKKAGGTRTRTTPRAGNARGERESTSVSAPSSRNTTPKKSGSRTPGRETSPLAKLREDNWLVTESPHQGRTSTAFLLSRTTEDFDEDEELFAKRVQIMSPENGTDPAIREERILHSLHKLVEHNICFNFVTVVVSGPTSDALHLELVMEKGGDCLSSLTELSLAGLREVLFQLIYALTVAQREFRFVHYDLHHGNLLVSSIPPGKYCQITTLQGHTHFLRHCLALVADFGLSCLEDEDYAVYNKKNAMRGAFDPSHDLVHFVPYLNRLQISDRAEDANVGAMKQLKSLKRLMGMTESSPAQLLGHEFFQALRQEPPSGEECWKSAMDASIPRAKAKKKLPTSTSKTPLSQRSSSRVRDSSIKQPPDGAY